MMNSGIVDIVCLVGMAEGRYVMGFVSDASWIREITCVLAILLIGHYRYTIRFNVQTITRRLPSILHEQG